MPAQRRATRRSPAPGSTWSQNALDQWRTQRRGELRHDGQLHRRRIVGRVAATSSRAPSTSRSARSRTSRSPKTARPRGAAARLRLHADRRRRHVVHVPPEIGGKRVTNLRLSGDMITKIFTGGDHELERPGDPGRQSRARDARQGDRAGGALGRLGHRRRSSRSGCRSSTATCGPHGHDARSSRLPAERQGARAARSGVAGYVSQGYGEGAITYVEYSYALEPGSRSRRC